MFKNIGFILSLFLMSSAAVWGQATSDVYYQWGNKLYVQGNYDLCIKYYKAAIQVDPQNWKAYQALGSCEYHLGQKDQSIQDFNQSLALNPNNPPLQNFVNQISGGPAVPQAPAMASTNNNQISRPQVYGDSRLPKQGSISWTIGWAAESLSNQDLITDYAPDVVTFASEPIGAEFDFGADYTLSQSFQLGAQIQFIEKEPEEIDSFDESTIFSESCAGLEVEGKYLLPLSEQFRLILEGQAGFYTLVGSTIVDSDLGTINLSSSGPGGFIGAEIEWVLDNGGWGIDLGLGYRALSFDTITATSSSLSSPTTLKNGTTNWTFDFSGPRVNAAVRFF
jgi:tetratricopeptide (TPR) repeat protein